MDFSNSLLLNNLEMICSTLDSNYLNENNKITICAEKELYVEKSIYNFKDNDSNVDSAKDQRSALRCSKSYKHFLHEKLKSESQSDIFSKINDKDLFISLIYVTNKMFKYQVKNLDINKNNKDNDFFNYISNNMDFFERENQEEILYKNFINSKLNPGMKPHKKMKFNSILKEEFNSPFQPFKFVSKQINGNGNKLSESSEISSLIETIILQSVESKTENFELLHKKISKKFDCDKDDIINLWQVFKFMVSFELLSKNKRYQSDEDFWKIILAYVMS